MGNNILLNDGEQYSGQYVATKSFADKEVISHGDSPVEVSNEAKEKGVNDPVVFFVPEKNIVQIY